MGMIDAPTPQPRWFHLTPDRAVVALLVVECLLWLSERLQLFAFNRHRGWTVLIAVACVVVAMLLMLLWFVVALIFRWQFQFSIRSLLVLVVVVAVPCSWLAVKVQQVRQQRETLEILAEIGRVGGLVGFDPNRPLTTRLSWAFPLLRHAGPGLLSLLEDECVVEYVELRGTAVTDAWLEHLKGLPHLHGLGLDGAKVTDAGLEHLRSLSQLNKLDLSNTRVTDAGLEHLRGLTHLQLLVLKQTHVTDDGVAKLQQALPGCGVER
jgi:hypothetical protein